MRKMDELGEKLCRMIRENMLTGYRRPIRRTGALMADVCSKSSGNTVTVGNRLKYGVYVHAKRPYIRDVISSAEARDEICRAVRENFMERIVKEYGFQCN